MSGYRAPGRPDKFWYSLPGSFYKERTEGQQRRRGSESSAAQEGITTALCKRGAEDPFEEKGVRFMRFAENNRISHRQLYRQMILALLAPFMLASL